jgi:hypothetical protein
VKLWGRSRIQLALSAVRSSNVRLSHLQKFPKPKDMSAPPSKAEIGGVTDAQAPELDVP